MLKTSLAIREDILHAHILVGGRSKASQHVPIASANLQRQHSPAHHERGENVMRANQEHFICSGVEKMTVVATGRLSAPPKRGKT